MLVCHIRDRPNLDEPNISDAAQAGVRYVKASLKKGGRFRVSSLLYTICFDTFFVPALIIPTHLYAASSSLLHTTSRWGLSVAKDHQGPRHHGHACKEGVGSVVVLRVIFQCCGQELLEGDVNHDATDQTEQNGKSHRADDFF